MTRRQQLIRLHFGLLLFLLGHAWVQGATGYGLHAWLIFFLKLTLYGSGAVLYFISRKPFRRWRLYFGIYVWSPLVILLGWTMDGIFGAILASVFFFFMMPPQYAFRDGPYLLEKRYHGFLGLCCTYDIIENRYLLLQQRIGEIELQEMHHFRHSRFTVKDQKGYLRVSLEAYGDSTGVYEVDTILIIPVK